jgi:hypothetical protein
VIFWELYSILTSMKITKGSDRSGNPCFGIRQAHEQGPPVIHQGDRAGIEAAAFEVLRGKAAPAPLVLQFIKGVLAVGAITVELCHGADFVR